MPLSKADAGGGAMPIAIASAPGDVEALSTLPAFLAALAPVLVSSPVFHGFDGAIEVSVATAVWTWIARDIAPGPVAIIARAMRDGTPPRVAFDAVADDLLERIRTALACEADDPEIARRNTLQLGGTESRRRLPYVIMAIRRRDLLDKAVAFGRALGTIPDQAAIAIALRTVTIRNRATRALWMQAMAGAMANPARVMGAVAHLAGGRDEAALSAAGYAPLVDAMLSHTQNQLAALMVQPGLFNDYDRACRAVDRFHRLMRALSQTCEFGRRAHWTTVVTDLTARFSERLERPLRQIPGDVAQALRRPRETADRVDPDRVLAALNGLYLLGTIRKSRDSLAVNAALDQVWADTGQALEALVMRALDAYRQDPSAAVARARLDAGIKMAEIRFNADYADILRRARDGAERRMQSIEPDAVTRAS